MYTDDIPILDVAEKEKIEKKRTQMLNEPIPKLICKMAVPTIISMLVTSFYNLVDTFFVGQLGSNSATGAVGLVFSLMAIIQAFGYFFGHGSGNFISRAIGKRDYENAAKMASTGLFSSVFIGGLILAFGLMFRRPLVFLLGATPSMADDTVAYMTYILIGAPYMVGAFVL
ncbi:MAG: MATE family efflux transporter, partial [Clostridia bacterium]|nr:MATE family efflux transporter [Clostridia bacterium]